MCLRLLCRVAGMTPGLAGLLIAPCVRASPLSHVSIASVHVIHRASHVSRGAAGTLVAPTAPVGAHPIAVAVDEHTRHVFVLSAGPLKNIHNRGSVSMLDAATGMVRRTIRLGFYPQALAVDRRAARAFVVTQNSSQDGSDDDVPGTVSVLDTATGSLLRTVTVGHEPMAVAVDERTGRAFIANKLSDSVSVLDAATGTTLRTVTVGPGGSGGYAAPSAVAVDERTGHVFVLDAYDDSVRMLDATTGKVLHSSIVGTDPRTIVVDGQAGRAFVPSDGGLQVLDTHTGDVLSSSLSERSGLSVSLVLID